MNKAHPTVWNKHIEQKKGNNRVNNGKKGEETGFHFKQRARSKDGIPDIRACGKTASDKHWPKRQYRPVKGKALQGLAGRMNLPYLIKRMIDR